MDTSLTETIEAGKHATHDKIPHLSAVEWQGVERMAATVGAPVVSAMLFSLSRDEQHSSIAQFIQRELDVVHGQLAQLKVQADQQAELIHQQATHNEEVLKRQESAAVAASRLRRPESLKIDISKYKAADGDSLLRWFVALDDAIVARRIEDDSMQIAFAMSNMAGRAKSWALGLKLRNPFCFETFREFKAKLRATFEPPRSEFRARTEFLEMKQGKCDIHAYAQQARYLVSCIVAEPVDEQTQIVSFIRGLADGPIKTQLFRSPPKSLEEAIKTAITEDFGLQQAYVHLASYRPPRKVEDGSGEAMDLSYAESTQPRAPVDKRTQKCNRCGKNGHYAYECNAPRPVPNANGRNDRPEGKGKSPTRGFRAADGKQQRRNTKNGRGQ